MCTSLSPNCQYSELSLKQNVTIPVTKLSPPAAISKATVAFGARTRPSQQPSQLRNVCSRSRRRKSLHVWYSPLVAKRKLVQHRLNTKYRPWTSSRENFCDIQLLKARCLICFLSIGILSGSPRCYFCPLQFYRPDLAAANWQQWKIAFRLPQKETQKETQLRQLPVC